jgi:predicted Zn-dependent protease
VGLALAIGFTVLLNVTIVSAVAWPAWLHPQVTLACGSVTLLLWIVALFETRGELRRLADEQTRAAEQEAKETSEANDAAAINEPTTDPLDEQFARAQQQYIRGDWLGAEQTLTDLLRQDREDFAADLLLATMWRRTGRLIEAERKLTSLERREAATPWRLELSRERQRIELARKTSQQHAA